MLTRALRWIPWLAVLNGRLKARATKSEYAATVAHYEARSNPHPPLPRLARGARRLRTLFVGTDEQQDRSGTVQALERLTELTLFTREDGGYGHNDWRAPAIRR